MTKEEAMNLKPGERIELSTNHYGPGTTVYGIVKKVTDKKGIEIEMELHTVRTLKTKVVGLWTK